jgi:hypothetical protein
LEVSIVALLLRCIFCAVLWCFLPAFAAAKQEVLFDVIFDMDHEGALDRAVLVGQGRTDAGSASKDFYQLYPGERADLLIYLNHGDGVLDLNKLPTLRKDNIISGDELAFVMPLAVNARGSLNVVSSNGFGNTFNTTETLTIVYRDGAFLVAGWAQDFYNSRQDESSHCSVNYLAGKAVKRVSTGKDVRLKGVFKPVPLTEWTVAILPTLCEE